MAFQGQRDQPLRRMDTLGHHRCGVVRQAWMPPQIPRFSKWVPEGSFGRKLSEGPREGLCRGPHVMGSWAGIRSLRGTSSDAGRLQPWLWGAVRMRTLSPTNWSLRASDAQWGWKAGGGL